MIARPSTVDEWMERLQCKSLKFLQDQTASYIRGHNGKEYDTAVMNLIVQKRDAGDRVVCLVLPTMSQIEEEGEVEIIPYGGKGGSLRIVHPAR